MSSYRINQHTSAVYPDFAHALPLAFQEAVAHVLQYLTVVALRSPSEHPLPFIMVFHLRTLIVRAEQLHTVCWWLHRRARATVTVVGCGGRCGIRR